MWFKNLQVPWHYTIIILGKAEMVTFYHQGAGGRGQTSTLVPAGTFTHFKPQGALSAMCRTPHLGGTHGKAGNSPQFLHKGTILGKVLLLSPSLFLKRSRRPLYKRGCHWAHQILPCGGQAVRQSNSSVKQTTCLYLFYPECTQMEA